MTDALPPYLTIAEIDELITRALQEDVGPGDVTTEATIPPETQAEGHFLAKADGVLAGLAVARRVFFAVDDTVEVEWMASDGDAVAGGTVFGIVRGRARSLLVGERLSLNLLQRMSGIATATHRLVEATRPYNAKILDTRKTAPGLRLLDKWAVRLGGGQNHRVGLYDLILIKDNHVVAAGGVAEAIRAAQSWKEENGREDLRVEIEARTLGEVQLVLDTGGVDIVMLDNMTQRRPDGSVDVSLLREAVARIEGRFETEASGNVTLDTVPAIAATGVDFISSGALTHSVQALDISLKIELQ